MVSQHLLEISTGLDYSRMANQTTKNATELSPAKNLNFNFVQVKRYTGRRRHTERGENTEGGTQREGKSKEGGTQREGRTQKEAHRERGKNREEGTQTETHRGSTQRGRGIHILLVTFSLRDILLCIDSLLLLLYSSKIALNSSTTSLNCCDNESNCVHMHTHTDRETRTGQ